MGVEGLRGLLPARIEYRDPPITGIGDHELTAVG
jgi:hypothetical protein